MAKRKKDTGAEKALKDFIRESGISLSDMFLMLQEETNSAESRAIEADVEDMNKGGMAKKRYRPGGLVTKKKYVNPVTVVDKRKKKK